MRRVSLNLTRCIVRQHKIKVPHGYIASYADGAVCVSMRCSQLMEEVVSVASQAVTASGQTENMLSQETSRCVSERDFHERSNNIYSVNE